MYNTVFSEFSTSNNKCLEILTPIGLLSYFKSKLRTTEFKPYQTCTINFDGCIFSNTKLPNALYVNQTEGTYLINVHTMTIFHGDAICLVPSMDETEVECIPTSYHGNGIYAGCANETIEPGQLGKVILNGIITSGFMDIIPSANYYLNNNDVTTDDVGRLYGIGYSPTEILVLPKKC
jgi:hypothetical protein